MDNTHVFHMFRVQELFQSFNGHNMTFLSGVCLWINLGPHALFSSRSRPAILPVHEQLFSIPLHPAAQARTCPQRAHRAAEQETGYHPWHAVRARRIQPRQACKKETQNVRRWSRRNQPRSESALGQGKGGKVGLNQFLQDGEELSANPSALNRQQQAGQKHFPA
jgi:hypothetical protein